MTETELDILQSPRRETDPMRVATFRADVTTTIDEGVVCLMLCLIVSGFVLVTRVHLGWF